MNMKTSRILLTLAATAAMTTAMAADVKTNGNIVTIRPDGGQAKVVQLEVINDNIIRVRATSKDELPVKPQSLMILPQKSPAKGSFSIEDAKDAVCVQAKNVRAVVDKQSGEVLFYDGQGKQRGKVYADIFAAGAAAAWGAPYGDSPLWKWGYDLDLIRNLRDVEHDMHLEDFDDTGTYKDL